MTRHTVPSTQFWTVTPFAFSTPDGWSARPTVEHLAYLTRDDEPATNLGVQWKRVSHQLELRQIAQMTQNLLRHIDDTMEVKLSSFGRLHGRMSYLRIADFTPEGGSRKRQAYTAFFGPSFGLDRPIELFELVGHFDVDGPDRLEELSNIVESFQLGAESFGGESVPSGRGLTPADDDITGEATS